MTRCSYIPPEGLSVIAIAKERGGATDGDIQALVDRFGCRAEATRIIGQAGSTVIEAHACDDHVGHLLGDIDCAWVEPAWDGTPDVATTIVETGGVRLADFGTPIVLSQSPTAPPVVDLGTNPTREQLEAHGFCSDSVAYREAQAAFAPMPLPTPQTVGVARPPTTDYAFQVTLTCEHGLIAFPCEDPIVDIPGDGTGRLIAQSAVSVAMLAWLRRAERDGVDLSIECGSAFTVRCARIAKLRHECFERSNGTVHIEVEFRAIGMPVELRPANRPIDENTTCPATSGGSMHTYAVGDEVDWRTGPLSERGWTRGRVTSIVDDRPNDGIDKPFWIVRVDTAGERRFAGPAVAVCLRRPRAA